MPVFRGAIPLSRPQRRRRWIAAGLTVAAGTGFAVWAALDCARYSFGYIASYSFAIVFILACFLAAIGLLLMIYWRTRSTGAALLGTGIFMYVVFLGSIEILKKFDKVAWQHEPPMQRFGPGQRASLVIYYRPGTTQKDIEDFVEHRLESYPSKLHDGKGLPEFVMVYMSLAPSEANGFDGSALTFTPGAHGATVDSFVSMVQSDPRVEKVFRDMSPDAIHLPKVEQAPASLIHKSR